MRDLVNLHREHSVPAWYSFSSELQRVFQLSLHKTLPAESTWTFSVSEEASKLAQADCQVASHADISSTF